MCEIQISANEHHREQQDNSVVVHRAIRALRCHHSGRDHQYGAEQCRCRAIQRQNLELAPANEDVGDGEDDRRDKFLLPMIHSRA